VSACQRFAAILRERRGADLDAWSKEAEESGSGELQSFVRSIRQDWAAVVAGLSLEISNGQTEGVRRVTQLWISPQGMELEGRFQGHPPYSASKGNEDQSMAGKRCRCRGVTSPGTARPVSYGKSLIARNPVLTV
jgi:hypothetical protein